jgi:hypothetical protein
MSIKRVFRFQVGHPFDFNKPVNFKKIMKRFISTKLFLALQEVSQKGIDKDAKVLKHDYDEFVIFVFQSKTTFTDKAAYHDALVYTRVELATLPDVSGEKYGSLSSQSHRTH